MSMNTRRFLDYAIVMLIAGSIIGSLGMGRVDQLEMGALFLIGAMLMWTGWVGFTVYERWVMADE